MLTFKQMLEENTTGRAKPSITSFKNFDEAMRHIKDGSKLREKNLRLWLNGFQNVKWNSVDIVPVKLHGEYDDSINDYVFNGIYTGASNDEIKKGTAVTFRFKFGMQGGTGQLKIGSSKWQGASKYASDYTEKNPSKLFNGKT